MRWFKYILALVIALGLLKLVPLFAKPEKSQEKPVPANATVATLAGGCFWCIEAAFEGKPGIYTVTSGYSGGDKPNPTYREVASGKSGYVETVQIKYDPKKISFAELLEIYWRNINPTDAGGQFVDRGPQYQAIIFYHDEKQKEIAEESKQALAKSGRFDKPILTPIRAYKNFYPAEEYHQGFYRKSPLRYKMYKKNSGRDSFLGRVWKDLKEKVVENQ